MALTARKPSGADTAGLIPEIWSRDVLDIVKSNLVCLQATDTTWSSDISKVGDTVNIPILNSVTATEVVVGTEITALDPATGTKVQLVANEWWAARIPVDEMTDFQSQVEQKAKYQNIAAYAIQAKIDSTVNALYSALNSSTVLGADGQTWTEQLMKDAVELLDEADAPADGRFWIVDPSVKADMMGIDVYTRSDYGYGDVIPAGAFRKNIMGAPMLITNNLTAATTGNYCAYLSKYAIASAVQKEWATFTYPEPLKSQINIITKAIWGLKEVRDTWGVAIYSRKS